MREHRPTEEKVLFWVGSSAADLARFPPDVQDEMGFALSEAQYGAKHVSAKPLKGFGGAGVLEIVENDEGGTYRAVYTVNFPDAVFMLHAFQKKSKKGIATSKKDVDLIRKRLAAAEAAYKEWCHERKKESHPGQA